MIKPITLLAGIALAGHAHAGDFSSLGTLGQDEFHRLSQDLGAALSYKGVTPATPLGLVGFDVGLEVADTRVRNASVFGRAGAGSPSDLVIPKLHVYKGLFGGLDIGAFVGGASAIHAALFGADLRYALLEDSALAPAVALRLSGTKATGLGDLSVSTGALDVMVSKRFTALTPYLGAGAVRVMSRAKGTGLADETIGKGRFFGGINVNLVAVNLAFEAERMGDNTSLSAKIGWRF